MKATQTTNGRRGSFDAKVAPVGEKAFPLSTDLGGVQPGRRIGLWGGVSMIVSLMIGSGIFTYAGEIHSAVGSTSLALGVWLAAGILALTGALCYAELGTMIPGSGGEAQYLSRGIGPLTTYLFDWASILILKPGTVAIMMIAFTEHMFAIGKELGLGAEASVGVTACAGIGCIIVGALACYPRLSERILGALTFSKVAALAAIIGGGVWYGVGSAKGHVALHANFAENFWPGSRRESSGATVTLASLVSALCNGLWGFEGWNNLNIVAGDLVRPERNLPLAISVAVGSVLGLYLLTLLGYYCVLPSNEFVKTRTAALHVGKRLALEAFGPEWEAWGGAIVAAFVMGSTFSAALSSMITSAEIITLSARSGRIPKMFASNNAAYVMQAVLALLLTLVFNNDLIVVYTLPTWIFYAACAGVLLALRIREPELLRPYKVRLFVPVAFLAACALLVGTTTWSQPFQVGISVATILLGVPVYYFFVRA
jgi:amino acid transporter